MKSSEGFVRMRTLQGVVLFIFLLIAGRLAYIQLVDSKYNELAKANVLRHVVQYPPRGGYCTTWRSTLALASSLYFESTSWI